MERLQGGAAYIGLIQDMSTTLFEQRVGKLKGHAEHLLDLFRRLRARFAFLEPMLFDSEVVATHSQGRKGHGFGVIRDTLLYACVQDIANLTSDKDHRTPSIAKIMADLEDPTIRARLRDGFSAWSLPPDQSWEPKVADAIRKDDQARKRARFDTRYAQAVAGWETLRASSVLVGFRKMRDKLTAHTELRYDDEGYRLLNVKALGLRWNDVRSTIDQIERLVDAINLMVRNSSFMFDGMRKSLERDRAAFWDMPAPTRSEDGL